MLLFLSWVRVGSRAQEVGLITFFLGKTFTFFDKSLRSQSTQQPSCCIFTWGCKINGWEYGSLAVGRQLMHTGFWFVFTVEMNEWHWSRDGTPWVACWLYLIRLAIKHVRILASNQNSLPELLLTWSTLQSAHTVPSVIPHNNTQPFPWCLAFTAKPFSASFGAWLILSVRSTNARHADTSAISGWLFEGLEYSHTLTPTDHTHPLVIIICKNAAKVAKV